MMPSLRQGGGGGVGDDGHGAGTASGVVFASPPRTRQSQHAHLDMDVGKTPRMTNAGNKRRGTAGALGKDTDDRVGVAVDDLTASLLGVHFLPFADDGDGDGGGGASDNSALQNYQQSDHNRERDADADLCFGDLEDNSTLTEDPADALARKRRRKDKKNSRSKSRRSTKRI